MTLFRFCRTSVPALCAIIIAAQLIAGDAFAAKKRFIAISTGGPTGVYFAAGNAICRLVHKEAAAGRKHGLRCSAPSTNGSTYNIAEIFSEEFDFGMVQSDWHIMRIIAAARA